MAGPTEGTAAAAARSALGAAVRSYATQRGWRQADLARNAGVPPGTLAPLWHGRAASQSSTFTAVVTALFPDAADASGNKVSRSAQTDLLKQRLSSRRELEQLWEQATRRSPRGKTATHPEQEAFGSSTPSAETDVVPNRSSEQSAVAGSGADGGSPEADLIRAVEDFVQQISGLRADGFVGSTAGPADTAFAARAWEGVHQAVEQVQLVSPDAGDHAVRLWQVVNSWYGTYLQWADPEPADDYATSFGCPEPADSEHLKILGARASEALRGPMAAFRARWRELH